MARTAKYDAKYCDDVIDYASQGLTRDYICYELKIAHSTFHEWIKTYPEFKDAVARADTIYKTWLSNLPSRRGHDAEFNDRAWAHQMRFYNKMGHNRTVEIPELLQAVSPTDQAQAIKNSVAKGEITPDEAGKLSKLVESQVNIELASELTDEGLSKKITEIEGNS